MNTEDVPYFICRREPALAFVIHKELAGLRKAYGNDVPISDYILGAVLAPLASQMLRREDQGDRSILFSLFAALDELLDDPNPNMVDVVFVSFLEQLAQDKEDWERARAYMGQRLRKKITEG